MNEFNHHRNQPLSLLLKVNDKGGEERESSGSRLTQSKELVYKNAVMICFKACQRFRRYT